MGCMLRSDPMSFCDIYLQPEAAFEIISHLGELGCVQFTDLNPKVQEFQRNYVSEVCRCAEMERKLRYMEKAMMEDDIYLPEAHDEPKGLHPIEMVAYENMFEKWEADIIEMSANQTNLMKNYLEMTEMYYVLSHIGPMLGDAVIGRDSIFQKKAAVIGDLGPGGRLIVMTGVVRRSRCFHLEMMLWRIARGNIYYRQAPEDKILEDPVTRSDIRKVAFLALCQGEQLTDRMGKVFSGFRVNIYPCPETLNERMEMMEKLDVRLEDLRQVLEKTKYLRCKALRTVGRKLPLWMMQVKKTKAIYHTMNLFNLDVTKKCLLGQCWIPDQDYNNVKDILKNCSIEIGSNVPSFILKKVTSADPPTYHRTNKYTHGFQALINAYGDSTYGELNPGLYTISTFPFLFGMMFSDFCHGFIVVCFSGWMIYNEKKFMRQRSTNEIWNIFFAGRYVILLMGLFSMYTGFLYNEFFSRRAAFGTSAWVNTFSVQQLASNPILQIDPDVEMRTPYLFGIDPIWAFASNTIMHENSIKMKMSIIVGIVHMIFGIVLSLYNHRHFQRKYAIYLEFIPQLLFLTCIFFWLVFLIYYKWFTYGARFLFQKAHLALSNLTYCSFICILLARAEKGATFALQVLILFIDLLFFLANIEKGATCAPQVLILFIDMFLMETTKPLAPDCNAYMFDAQHSIQIVLMLIGTLCIPVLLFGSPIYLIKYNKKKRDETLAILRYNKRDKDDNRSEEELLAEIEKYSAPFGDLMIHQGVHTIEFVLSTVSHTASYLRLWALSLAHTQLAEMLWKMVLSKLALQEFSLLGTFKLFIIFAVFAAFTLSITVIMEGLSAFLHTLRLHWVEFMSKFYGGLGYPFRPFYFKTILATDEKHEAIRKGD